MAMTQDNDDLHDGTDSAPDGLFDALKSLPSETASLPSRIDEAVLATARKRLAGLRRRVWIKRVSPILAAAACVALVYLGIASSRRPIEPLQASHSTVTEEDEAAHILRELEMLFPGNLSAVTLDEGELQIELSETTRTEQNQAVVIELCKKGHCHEIITYVGQTIEIEGQPVIIHADPKGHIIFEGKEGLWMSGEAGHANPELNIRTRII